MKSATDSSTVSLTAPPQPLYEFQPRTLVARGCGAAALLARGAAHASSSSSTPTLRSISQKVQLQQVSAAGGASRCRGASPAVTQQSDVAPTRGNGAEACPPSVARAQRSRLQLPAVQRGASTWRRQQVDGGSRVCNVATAGLDAALGLFSTYSRERPAGSGFNQARVGGQSADEGAQ